MNHNDQLTLFPDPSGKMSKMETEFWDYHGKHPEIYRYLVQFAREWRLIKGKWSTLSIKGLFERTRWEMAIQSGRESLQMNNNHTAFYARLIMDSNADLKGIFTLRRQRTEMAIK
jgi:hypothetical protein